MACRRCGDACIANVLAVDADGPRLAADCLHCGRCQAACPTGALQVAGFDDHLLPIGNQQVSVECWKVPAELTDTTNVLVPCIAGITQVQLLEWMLAAGQCGLAFVDRDWCQGCSAGGDGFVGYSLLADLRPWLEDCAVPAELRPTIKPAPLLPASMPATIPSPESRMTMSRRSFFRRIGREIARSERPAPPAGPRSALRGTPCPQPARERLLSVLTALAARYGRVLPPRAMPRLTVSPACRDHGLCARLCPTGALARQTDEKASRLVFNAATCVSCNRCVASCPEGALALGDGGSVAPTTQRAHGMRRCVECGRDFADHGPSILCPRCSGNRLLARQMFGPLIAEDSAGANANDSTGGTTR